jgi:hypothetical protein
MEESKNVITNHLIIKNILLDIKDRNQLMTLRVRDHEVRGTFSALDPVMDGLKIVLDRKVEHRANEKIQVEFVYKKDFYTFECELAKSIGSSAYLGFPKKMTYHPNRGSKRLQVLDKKIPVRIQFLGAARPRAFRKDVRIEPSELDRVHHELNQDVPDLAEMGKHIASYLHRLGDRVDLKLGKIAKLFHPAERLFQESRALYMPDAQKADSFLRARPDVFITGQFADFLASEHGEISDSDAAPWQAEYQVRKITSEVFAPVTVMGSVIGYLYCGSSIATPRKISPNDVLSVLALADAFAEAVVKRNINSKNDKEIYHIQLADISEGGMQILVGDPILNKILGVANQLMVSLQFFDKWIKTYGEIVRVRPAEGGGETGLFSIKFHPDDIPSSDRIQLKRVINYFETNV